MINIVIWSKINNPLAQLIALQYTENFWYDFQSYKLVLHMASSVRVQRQRVKIEVLCTFSGGIKKEWLPLLNTFLQWHEFLFGPAPFC